MRFKLGDAPKEIHENLTTVCGDQSCSYRTVCRWVSDFSDGKESVLHEPHSGRPKSAVNELAINQIRDQISEDPHVTIRELSDTNGISYGSVQTILKKELGLKKLCARWIPHLLTDEQKRERVRCATELLNMFEPHGPKRLTDIVTGDETWISYFGIPSKRQNRMWVDEKGDRPVVLRPGFQSRKRLFTVFFNCYGPVVVDILPKDTTMTSAYYVQNILPQIKTPLMSSGQQLEPLAPCFFMTTLPPINQGPQLRLFKSNQSKFCPTLPTAPTSHLVTFGCFLF